jgi:hypothetical protein
VEADLEIGAAEAAVNDHHGAASTVDDAMWMATVGLIGARKIAS